MSARSRADARFTRHVPDFSHWERREPGARLSGRDERALLAADGPSASLWRRTEGAVSLDVRRSRIRVEAAPNAPLLMRLVRTPFALGPARHAKVVVPRREPPAELDPVALAAERHPGRAFGDLLRELRSTSPLRAIEHGLPTRLRPRRSAPETP